MTTLTELTVSALDKLEGDGEGLHHQADAIIINYLPIEVAEAYRRVQDRAEFWACA